MLSRAQRDISRVKRVFSRIPFNSCAFNGCNVQKRLVKLQLQTRHVRKRYVKTATPGLPQLPESPGGSWSLQGQISCFGHPLQTLSIFYQKTYHFGALAASAALGPISCFGHPPQTLPILYQKHMISVLWRPGRLLGQISCFEHPPTTLSNPYYLVAPIHSANGHRKVSRCGDLPHRCSWRPPPQKELANSQNKFSNPNKFSNLIADCTTSGHLSCGFGPPAEETFSNPKNLVT